MKSTFPPGGSGIYTATSTLVSIFGVGSTGRYCVPRREQPSRVRRTVVSGSLRPNLLGRTAPPYDLVALLAS